MKEGISLIKSKVNFNNIKSDYFLQKVFDYLTTKTKLKTIKHNKILQKRIKININNYKEHSELYSSIEIEIIPIKNSSTHFININKDEEKYYHIFINNNKKEIKKENLNKIPKNNYAIIYDNNLKKLKTLYLDRKNKISKIKIIIDHQVKSFSHLFTQCTLMESLYVKKCFRKDITDMSGMFEGCKSVIELNLSNLKTSNVTNMSSMFNNCTSLKRLDISNFNTNNVNNMCLMFYRCSSLEKINFSSNFSIDKIINMIGMFEESSKKLKRSMKNIFDKYLKYLKIKKGYFFQNFKKF